MGFAGGVAGWSVVMGIAIASLAACKATPESGASGSTAPLDSAPPRETVTAVDREPSALPPGVPPGAPATLGVNDMAGHPARWNGETVILFARLRYEIMACGKSVPAHCVYRWQLLDVDDARSMTVVLVHEGLDVPFVCRPAGSQVIPTSPCETGDVDPGQRYRLEGEFVYGARELRFLATRIEAVGP